MLRLILGRAGTGKTARVIEEICAHVAAREGKNILIVPEQYSYEAEKELLERAGDSASLYAEVLSFTRLSHTLARELEGSARVYTDKGGRALQMALALSKCAPSLQVYGGARQRSETILPLLSALDELRSSCAGPEALREAAGKCSGQLRGKLLDLATLQETVAALQERTGADPLTRLDTLAENVSRSTALRGGRVYIDGFTDFTAQERRVIRELWQAGDVTVCLTCDRGSGEPGNTDGLTGEEAEAARLGFPLNSEEFTFAVHTALRLKQEAEEDKVKVKIIDVPAPAAEDPLSRLERSLFSYTEEHYDSEGRLSLVTAASLSEECELAAGEILHLVRDTGCRWRDIAVAVRGFEDYQRTLESVFERFGIPLYTSRRTDILSKPLPALTLSALSAIAGGWSYEDMFTYLKTGLAGLTTGEVDILENYVLLWGIRGSGWYAGDWAQHPDGLNQDPDTDSEKRLARLNELRKKVAAPLRKLQEAGRKAVTAAEQCRALADFWEELELGKQLLRREALLKKLGQDRAAEECRQLWDIAAGALEQCALVLGDEETDQESFARLLKLLLSQYDVGTIPVAADRVTAGDFDRMRRRSLKHLLVLGCTDERFPRVTAQNGVFTDPERDELRRLPLDQGLSLSLETGDDRLSREFSLIYNVLTLPSETLWLSRPLYNSDGAALRPSFVVTRVNRLFGLEEQPGDTELARSGSRRGAAELAAGGNREALAYFENDPEELARLARLRTAASYQRGRLSPGGVRALYGDQPRLSPTRTDTLAACKFQYFLRYGLKAKVRPANGFDAPAMGTFLHYILEHCAKDAKDRGGFRALTDEDVREMAGHWTDTYIEEKLNGFREKPARFIYLFERLRDTVAKVVLDTARELRVSDFVPLSFECRLDDLPGEIVEAEADEETDAANAVAGLLRGTIDRVDGWEHNGKLYLRVADYKTGKKEFSLSDVYFGLSLQMLLYLFTLEREGEQRYGKSVESAGVLYVPARDDTVSFPDCPTDETAEKERAKRHRRSGLLLSDETVLRAMEKTEDAFSYLPVTVSKSGELKGDALASAEQLGQLSGYVDTLLQELYDTVKEGRITADPWFRSDSENACTNCSYFDACRFNAEGGDTEPDGEDRDCFRPRPKLKAPDFWEKLKGEDR